MLSKSLVLFATLAAAGCLSSNENDDIWMPPPPAPGKADGIDLLSGADIPSPLVDPAKHYLRNRTIDNLHEAGALDDFDTELAHRVDGIIDSMPADGRLHVAELVRIGQSPYVDALFPDERARLPHLWTMLEAPDDPDVNVDLPTSLDLPVVDKSVAPVPLAIPPNMTIPDLPTDDQRTAQRIELVSDDDSDPTTITLADIAMVVANPGAFTPGEIEIARAIHKLFIAAGTSPADAVAEVPAPGDNDDSVVVGVATLRMHSSVAYKETRYWSANRYGQGSWDVSFSGTIQRQPAIDMPTDAAALFVGADDRRESVVDATHGPALTGGRYLMEVWHAGDRLQSHWVVIPDLLERSQAHNLRDWVDYDLVTPSGASLVRNVTDAQTNGNVPNGYYATFSYDLTVVPQPATVDPAALDAVATPLVVEPGRYVFDSEGLTVDVYPQGVFRAKFHSIDARLIPRGGKLVDNRLDNYEVMYMFGSNRLTMFSSGTGTTLDTPLTPDMRAEM